MEKILLKYAHKIPQLINRALAGDPSAIAALAAMGIAAAAVTVKDGLKDPSQTI
ncbi:MAG: hypothetical protein Q4E89_11655 [Eubacteriales bacterium]|nr:hypothetical protein [Eubacteriales bacterium]